MTSTPALCRVVVTVACMSVLASGSVSIDEAAREAIPTATENGSGAPTFMVDPFWPKTLPNDWLIGRIAGIAADSQDRIFVVHRPGSLTADELGLIQEPVKSLCCRPAPPVLVFDTEGNLLDSWGGPGEGYDWPDTEHGIVRRS